MLAVSLSDDRSKPRSGRVLSRPDRGGGTRCIYSPAGITPIAALAIVVVGGLGVASGDVPWAAIADRASPPHRGRIYRGNGDFLGPRREVCDSCSPNCAMACCGRYAKRDFCARRRNEKNRRRGCAVRPAAARQRLDAVARADSILTQSAHSARVITSRPRRTYWIVSRTALSAMHDEITKVIYGQDQLIEFALAGLFKQRPRIAGRTARHRQNLFGPHDCGRAGDGLPPNANDPRPHAQRHHRLGHLPRRPTHVRIPPRPDLHQLPLADEVNRSVCTQSAMLEAMQELSVTYDGVTHPLPPPFITFATENPIEQEGTYPLPLAATRSIHVQSNRDLPAG